MKRYIRILSIVLLGFCVLGSGNVSAQQLSAENLKAREEFSQARFGIFIHWGIYSMLGRGEWVMQNENLDYQEYARLANGFCPSKFNAGEWVKLFKEAGAKYITFTSRHHDGFSMFQSDASAYNIKDATPFKRDVVGELAEACSKEGIKLHLYYSHLDWGRTDYWPQGRTGDGTGRPQGKDGDWEHYMQFVDKQLTELLTKYGPIGAVWFDGVWDKDSRPYEEQPAIWNLEHQYNLIHTLQPACLVGNNHHLNPFPGEDIQIFERDIPGFNEYGYSTQDISRLPLETCQTMNRSWGYKITDTDYKSPEFLIEYLVRTAAKGANLLLNVGPRPDGTIPEEAVIRLKKMGEWLNVYGESIYGTQAGQFSSDDWGVSTSKGNIVYLHCFKPVETIDLNVERQKLRSAQVMLDGAPVKFKQKKDNLTIYLPSKGEDVVDQIIILNFK